jgi:uncharacterized protein (UPF0371 family)
MKWLKQYLIGYRNEIVVVINRNQFMYNFIATKTVEAISYRNEIVVAINGIIATKILLHYMIFIATKDFIAKTYYHRVYCNGLQRLTFVAIKVYCNEMKVIVTKNFIAINLFSCNDYRASLINILFTRNIIMYLT